MLALQDSAQVTWRLQLLSEVRDGVVTLQVDRGDLDDGAICTPACLSSDAISLAWRSISPKAGLTVPRSTIRPALQFSGLSQGV